MSAMMNRAIMRMRFLSFFFTILSLLPIRLVADNVSSYPSWIVSAMNTIPLWSPPDVKTPACLAELKKEKINIKKCELTQDYVSSVDSFRRKIFFDYLPNEQNGFEKINFKLSDKVTVRGLLGLHKDETRPLVIFRMGIHGNRDEPLAERYLMKILFQDMGYHLLVLESLISHGHLLLNQQVSIGGFEEGLHTFFILQQIKNKKWPWIKQITDIHLAALSMGGLGAFLTLTLDEQTDKMIKSALLLCPLMNFQETEARITQPGLVNAFMDIWNSERLQVLKQKNPSLKDISFWSTLWNFKPQFTPAVIDWYQTTASKPVLTVDDFKKEFKGLKFPEPFSRHIENSHSFYGLNNFWSAFKNTKTPIEVIITDHDPLVFTDLNADRIVNKSQAGVFEKTKVTSFKGTHCSLAETYEWHFLVEYFKRSLN